MSVQFGICNFDGKTVDPADLDRVRNVLAPYGPDGEGRICKDNLGIFYRAFHTTKESRREIQPHVSASGSVLTWDGRLDNREELIGRLEQEVSGGSDVAMVAAAYDKWQTGAFAKLIGDWALSIWDPTHRSLLLVKDFVGTRNLYYSVEEDRATWSTILDPLVLFAGHSFRLEEEYVAGWLASFPAPHLTPYVGIHSVPPSSFVRLARKTLKVVKYWDFGPAKEIRYRVDAEYEEHFRVVFSESVRRRLRSDSPVLAELSGGIDSSSIVCVADAVFAKKQAETIRLDTVSYYDDSEPNWNERPYFTKVEEKRGRTGHHIDVSYQNSGVGHRDCAEFTAAPGSQRYPSAISRPLSHCMLTGQNRVLLSGIGGDELLGGVPTPIPEIADLLVTCRLRALARQLKRWALDKRKPWFYLLWDVCERFLPKSLARAQDHLQAALWLEAEFVNRWQATFQGYESRLKIFGPLPSFQENVFAIEALRRQLACEPTRCDPLFEARYAFLDRDLAELLVAMPREQLVRPGERRSLMRRALKDVLPLEILNRRRKAYVARAGLSFTASHRARLASSEEHMLCSAFGIFDETKFRRTCLNLSGEFPPIPLMRLMNLESWLRCTEQYLTRGGSPVAQREAAEGKEKGRSKKQGLDDFSWPAANEREKGGNSNEVRETANL